MSGSKPKKRGGSWDEDQLKSDMEAVRTNQLNPSAAALKFNIPRRTLRNHLKTGNTTKMIGKALIFSKHHEDDLAQRIKRFAKLGIPLTPKFIRKQAFLFCERFKLKHSFSLTKRMAGRKWLKMFLRRNPTISKRKPQILNPARAQKLNRHIVQHHFEEVKKLYQELDIIAHPERLYNMDEKGCRITVHSQKEVLAEKGSKRVHLVAPEHAENVTIAMCVNAVGSAIPPMILFKGVRYRQELKENLPAGTKVRMAPKGSMTSSLFVEFIQHLAQHKVPGKCLLIFDGAKSHLSFEALEEADKNNIVLYCLPSNTTHELQPLDKSVNRSFEQHWDEEVLSYLCGSSDRSLNKAAFNLIFKNTWPKCMTLSNVVNGFRATGLYPLDADAIHEDAYAPSILTERPLPEPFQEKTTSPSPAYFHDSPPMFHEMPEWSSPSLLEKRKPILVPYSSSTNASDTDLDNTIDDHHEDILLNSVNLLNGAENYPQVSLYDNPVPSTSGLQRNIVDSSSESDLDLNLSESFIKSNYNIKLHAADFYTFSSDEEGLRKKGEMTPERQLSRSKTKAQLKSYEVSSTTSSEDEEPLFNLKQAKEASFHDFLPTPNYAKTKSTFPRKKAINYKGQRIVKDLFKTEDKKKVPKQKTCKENEKTAEKRDQEKKNILNKNHSKKVSNRKAQQQQTKGSKGPGKSKKNKEEEAKTWYCYACCECRVEDIRECSKCRKWYHEECVGLTKNEPQFICPNCD